MSINNNVYSVLVCYEPEDGQVENTVNLLLNQVSNVVICNNSFYDIQFESTKVKVFNFNANLGIAAAQTIGMKWAFENGAEYILQMDQDSILETGTVERLLERFHFLRKNEINVGVIGPRHFDKVTNEVDESRLPNGTQLLGVNCESVHATISSACIIPKDVVDIAGYMEDRLFIDLVDWEYCWRIKKYGYITVRDNDVLLGHRVGDGTEKIIGKIDARRPSPIRHYYHTRNTIHMLSRSYVPLSFKIKNIPKLLLKFLIYPFVFSDGVIRFKYLYKGMVDGLFGRYGKIDF